MKLSEAKFYPVYDGEESLDDIFDMEIVEMDEELPAEAGSASAGALRSYDTPGGAGAGAAGASRDCDTPGVAGAGA